MINEKLKNQRKKIGLSQIEMSKICAMEQTTYSRKESGKTRISDEEWQRFANALQVDVEDIREEQKMVFHNENCTFHDSVQGTQYISIPKSLLETTLKYNAKLEEENKMLQEVIVSLKIKLSKI